VALPAEFDAQGGDRAGEGVGDFAEHRAGLDLAGAGEQDAGRARDSPFCGSQMM
jgi:hypothetical protein